MGKNDNSKLTIPLADTTKLKSLKSLIISIWYLITLKES
jgi:hypothetical protein